MPSPMLYATQIKIIANKTPPGTLVSWRHSLFRASHGLMLVGGWGSINLYHSIWEPPIMCVAWKISPSLGCYVDNESMPLKILFISISKPSSGTSTNPCFPLRRAYLFTFMLSHHPLFLFIFLFWQASCGEERSRHIYPVGYMCLNLSSPHDACQSRK